MTNVFVACFIVNFSIAMMSRRHGSRDRAVNGDMRSYSVECQNMNMVVAQEEGRGTSVSWSEPVTPRYVPTRVNVRAFVRTAHTRAAALPRIIPRPTVALGFHCEIAKRRIYASDLNLVCDFWCGESSLNPSSRCI